jgi:3-oxoacyl-[acyl-carrier protein] reductase
MSVFLVTGAGRGIGRGIALELSRGGHRVGIHYNRNRDAALRTARECLALLQALRSSGAAAGQTAPDPPRATAPEDYCFQADLARTDERTRLLGEVAERLGAIDGLVNNAGMAPRVRADILEATEESWEEVVRVNCQGPYFLTQAVARLWTERPSETVRRIVFITSVSAEMASTNRGEYCVSKAALSMTARLFAARLAGEGILVFEVRPGIIATEMTSGVRAKYDSLIADGLVPQKRWGEPDDVGRIVRAIADGAADFAAGSIINADGGLSIPRM